MAITKRARCLGAIALIGLMTSVSHSALATSTVVNGSDVSVSASATGIDFQSDNTATLSGAVTGDVTTATSGTGTLVLGSYVLDGNVGSSSALLKEVVLGTGGYYQITGNLYVQTLNLNGQMLYLDGETENASAEYVLGDVTTSSDGTGTLHLHGGNLTVNGSIGASGTALNSFSLDSRTDSTITFNSGSAIYADSISINASGGSDTVLLAGDLTTVGTLSIGSSIIDLEGNTWNQTGNVTISNATLRSSIAAAGGQTSCSGAAGCLVSSGTVTTNGTNTVALRVSAAAASGLKVGDTYTIIDGASGNTGIGTFTVTSLTSGYTFSQVTNGEDLIITVTGLGTSTNYTAKGSLQGSNGQSMGSTLDTLDNQTSSAAVAFQNSVLTVIDSLSSSEAKAEAIKSLSPVQTAPASQMSASAAAAVLGAVEQHQQTAMGYDPATGKAAGSDVDNSAMWGQVLGGGAIRGSDSQTDGYKSRDVGLAVGLDHMFDESLMGGVALSWIRGWSQGSDSSSGSTTTLDSYQTTLYGTYRQGQAFVDGQMGFGYNNFSQSRDISFLNSTASADYDGQQYLAKATLGYDVPVDDGVVVTPLAGLTWLRAVSDSYTETGAGSANLTVDRNGVNSLTQDLGGKVTWKIQSDLGTIKPEVRASWVHDYTKGAIATSGLLAGAAFTTTTSRPAADGARIGLAVNLSSDDNLSFRAEYEGEVRHEYQSHTGMIKAIWGF